MWGQIAAAAGSGSLGFLGGLFQRGRAKEIGTIEQQAAEDEERRIMARLLEQNPRFAEEYALAQRRIEETAGPQADLIMDATREGIGYLDPYAQAGARAVTGLEQIAGAKAPTAADLEFDPGYQFRLSEGQKALERSAAARGTLMGGGTLKALTRYSQGAASQEYANAFDRFMRLQGDRRATLSSLASQGLTAGQQAASNLMQGTGAAANIRLGAARDVGRLGIESRTVQEGNVSYADELMRRERARATAARTGSMTAASNLFWGGVQNAVGGAGQALSLWDLAREGRGGGGRRVPEWAIGGAG